MGLSDTNEVPSLNWLYLYLGSLICLIGLVVTRHTYKLSPGFRSRLDATNFFKLDLDAPEKEKASVMLKVLSTCWPSTVSEMLQDTEAAHGMVFRSLMITGCLIAAMTNLAALSPDMPGIPAFVAVAIGVVHVLRRIVFLMAVGFCFAPTTGPDSSVAAVREAFVSPASSPLERSESLSKVPLLRDMSIKTMAKEERAEIARSIVIGAVHVILAVGMLTFLPILELVVLACEAFFCGPDRVRQALALEPCAITWCTIVLLRLLHIVAIKVCMSVFSFHFLVGFLSKAKHHSFKGFWSEYTACRLFAQLMMLASIQSCFAQPEILHAMPTVLRVTAIVVATSHIVFFLLFLAPNTMLVLRNVERSEAQLAGMFKSGRKQDSIVQLLLDAQLAFVGCIQAELGFNEQTDTGQVRQWLFQQVQILLKFVARYNLHLCPSSSSMEHSHAD